MIKNIVFDIGNVLVRFQPDEAMREIGIEENKIAALAHATYENPVWVELDRGVIPENEIIDEMVKVAPQYEADIRRFFKEGKAFVGKQYKVSEGDIITIEKLGVDAGEKVTFDQVLAVSGDDMKVGNPTVAGATVEASVIKEGRAKKVIVYKYKRKTGYHKKNGHRQSFTQVKIEKING